MVLLPQRLFDNAAVSILFREGNSCILHKQLTEPTIDKEGYISNHVVSIILKGEQQLRTYEDELIRVKENEVLFIPRGLYHISDFLPKEGQFESLLFFFDENILHDFLSNTTVTTFEPQAPPEHLKFSSQASLRFFANTMIQLYQGHQINGKPFLKLKTLELLHLIADLQEEQAFTHFLFQLTLPKKRNIKSFMERNFDKPLKVEDYAYMTGRSLSSFRRDFRHYYDTTPQQWLKNKRLEKALLLLAKEELSVTQLALQVGYENSSYFIQEFKKKVGLSPKQYLLAKRRDQFLN